MIGEDILNNKEFILELWRIWVSRRLSKWAASFLIISGIGMLNPQWWYGLVNAAYMQITSSRMPPLDESPTTGWILLILGLVMVVLSVWESKRTRNKEVIGIRHKSIGNFPKEAIKPDLPFLQKLWHYREIDIDHSDSYVDGVLIDHQSILRRIKKVPVELDGILNTNTDIPVAYYGLTHIPLAFYLGYLLADNKYKIQLYELNNDSGRWNQLSGVIPSLRLITDYKNLASSTEQGDVILSIGISYPVHHSEIDELEIPNELGRISIEVENPTRQLINNQEQIEQVCNEFKSTLEHIKNTCPNRQRIHFFYSGPISLSFALGRCISERIDSEIVIYNYSIKETPKYNWSLSLNNSFTSINISPNPNKGENHASA